MSTAAFIAGILAVMVLVSVIANWRWPKHRHPPNCQCRLHRQQWPRPGGTL